MIVVSNCRKSETILSTSETGSFTDPRDGKIYETVKIGNQWIMAENLAYKPDQGKYWAYENDTSNVEIYGYLYDWETATEIAPGGWHLPTREEWVTFHVSLGGRKHERYKDLGGKMEKVYKQIVPGGKSGFHALFGGERRSTGEFMYLNISADFWSSSVGDDGPYHYYIDSRKDSIPHGSLDSKEGTSHIRSYTTKDFAYSVRLFKD